MSSKSQVKRIETQSGRGRGSECKFSRAESAEIAAEVAAAVQAMWPGLRVEMKSNRFNPGQGMKLTLEFAATREDGVAMTDDADAFLRYAEMDFGPLKEFTPEDLGAEFVDPKQTKWKIVGFRPRATKRPIICEGKDGRHTVWPTSSVLFLLRMPTR